MAERREGHGTRIISADDDSESSRSTIDHSIKEKTTVTLFGKLKTFAGLEPNEWIFVSLSVLNVFVAIGLTIDRLVELKKDIPEYTFAIILFINIMFCLFYAVHGVLREREFELYAYISGIFVLLLYIVIDLIVNSGKRTPLKWARFGVIVALGPPNIYFGVIVARDFGYLAFKTVGAAVELHKMYRQAGMFSCLLKFDLQLAISLAVFVITDVTNLQLEDKITVGLGIPLQLAWAVLGWIIMRKEISFLMWFFILASLLEPAYLIYRIYEVLSMIDSWDKKKVLMCSFLGAAFLAFVVRGLIIVSLKFVVNNFGKGLREKVFILPVTGDEPSIFPSKRDTLKCCGMICCGPLG